MASSRQVSPIFRRLSILLSRKVVPNRARWAADCGFSGCLTECQFCECDGGDYDGYVGQNGVGYVGARLAREVGVRAIKRCANKHLAIGGDGN